MPEWWTLHVTRTRADPDPDLYTQSEATGF